jgi:predicted RNA-binding Zn ribbon-like protein
MTGFKMETDLIVDFVNTAGFGPDREDLPTAAALLGWLEAHGLEPGPRATARDHEAALAVREALRDLLSSHNETDVDVHAATAVLEQAAQRARLGVCFADGAAQIEPRASGVPGAIGRILAAVFTAIASGEWERLKACRAEDCRYAFYDSAKNRSRAWCSMSVCGNRAKVQSFRARHA